METFAEDMMRMTPGSAKSLQTSCVQVAVPGSLSQGRIGVLEPTGVFAPDVAASAPTFLFFFFFRGIKAGGLISALRSDK